MPSYIELDKQASFPSASNAGKVIFGVDNSGQITVTTNTGQTTPVGGNTGDITFEGIKVIGAGTGSGDGFGYSTMELVPDNSLYGNDQYIILDPTTGNPGHIHVRAGGQIDNSAAHLYLGGEENNVLINDVDQKVHINSINAVSISSSLEQGISTQAIGSYSHAEGQSTKTGIIAAFSASVVNGVVTLSGTYGDVTGEFAADNRLYLYDESFDNNYNRDIFIISQSYYSNPNTIVELYDTGINTTTAYVGNLNWLSSNGSWNGDQTIPGDFAHAEGLNTTVLGINSHAEGRYTIAAGDFAHAEGNRTQALNDYSHAEGRLTIASRWQSHAEGNRTHAGGISSHAEGDRTVALGEGSHAEGYQTIASGSYSHAEGYDTQAIGQYSHTEGAESQAIGQYSHAEGVGTQAIGNYSHAEGVGTQAIGNSSHAEGDSTDAIGDASHAEGSETVAIGNVSHAEGVDTRAIGNYSHAEGAGTKTGTQNAYYAESVISGVITLSGSYGDISSQFGADNRLYLYDLPFDDYYGRDIFIISQSYFDSSNTIVELYETSVNTATAYVGDLGQGIANWAGNQTIPGTYSHAEGVGTQAIGNYSHAEGANTQAIGNYSHAEGAESQAIGNSSHAEGEGSIASGDYSHTEGAESQAIGNYSHAEGYQTIASADYQHVQGKYNATSSIEGAFIVGNGTDNNNRSNLIHAAGNEVQISGSIEITGSLNIVGTTNIRPYKVYTALLTQSGSDDPLDINTGNLTIGVTYLINDNSIGMDFTNVGAPNNTPGTYFVATGTTPNSWGADEGNAPILMYNTGAPVVTVLENTIGNIWFTYDTIGNYLINTNESFPINKSWVSPYSYSPLIDLPDGIWCEVNYLGDYISIYSMSGANKVDNQLLNTPIEIRVYN